MDDKKKIIIHEIEHWRRSKLLPEHYCDFLLNIYDLEHGQEKPEQGGVFGVTPSKIRNSNWKIWMLALLLIIVVSFTALNFNAFELPMQIAISIIFLAGFYGWGGSKLEKEPMSAQILIGMACLFLLFIGVYLLRLHGVQASVPVVGYVAFCSVIWIITGLLARLALFQLCGWVSLVFCYGWLLHYQLETLSWITLQFSWLPLAILFCWMSWIIRERNRQIGMVFFLLSLIVWYMPELYAMLYAEKYGSLNVQWLLLSKLLVEAGLLFAWRKKWTEWVV